MKETEVKEFRNWYYKEFGVNLDVDDEVFPIVFSAISNSRRLDLTNKELISTNKRLNKTIQILIKKNEIIDNKLIVNNNSAIILWWREKRHFTVMLSIIGCIILASISYGIFEYTKSGRISNFYNMAEKETIDNTVYVILKPSRSNFIVGKNCIILDNGSIAVPVHKK